LTNVLKYAAETYTKHLRLILAFSLAFIIAFLIPVFASFPTYSDLGAIFLRTASIYLNLNLIDIAVVVISVLFSLIFLSFAIVAINVIVKHSRTRTRVLFDDTATTEIYTGRVFIVLLLFTFILMVVNAATYGSRYSGIITAIAGLLLTPLFFYAPASIVIDDRRIARALRASVAFFARRFDYFLLWLVIAIVLLSVVDLIFVAASGTLLSRYVVLIIDSLFVLPFLVVVQSEMYMKRFAMLKR
jgi:hypothetical protein